MQFIWRNAIRLYKVAAAEKMEISPTRQPVMIIIKRKTSKLLKIARTKPHFALILPAKGG